MNLGDLFGPIDIHVFDQLHRGRLVPGMRVLDAGCGGGRNLVFMLREAWDVWGVDADSATVAGVRELCRSLAPDLDAEQHFRVATVEEMPFEAASFDYIICNAVLHFGRDEAHLRAMVTECARVLKAGGTFFARLMSTHGVKDLVRPLGGRHFLLPDGAEVLLVDEDLLAELTRDVFQGGLADPLKSTIVHGRRTMTTWVVRRG